LTLIWSSLSNSLQLLVPFFMKITSVCGLIVVETFNIISSWDFNHLYSRIILLVILYLINITLFLAAHFTIKVFFHEPPAKKPKTEESTSPQPDTEESNTPPSNPRPYCPCHPYPDSICTCSEDDVTDYTPSKNI